MTPLENKKIMVEQMLNGQIKSKIFHCPSTYYAILLSIILVFAISGCVGHSDLINIQTEQRIPDGARWIIVEFDENPFDNVYDLLLDKGFRIANENEERGVLDTEGIDVGEETVVRLNVRTDEQTARIQADWMPSADAQMLSEALSGLRTESQWKRAEWGDTRRDDRAIAYVINLFQGKDYQISYEK